MTEVLLVIAGLALGALAGALAARPKLARAQRELDEERAARTVSERETIELAAALEHERRAISDRVSLRTEVTDAFKLLSAEALQQLHREARSDLEQRQRAVEQAVAPIKESLARVDHETRELEKTRGEAYGRLTAQVEAMALSQASLQRETASLVTALRAPAVRGRWGEMQLRRVVELAGMVAHCDFVEQATGTVDGRQLRPDLVVRLPGDRNIVVDAKVPLEAYLAAIEADDEDARAARLRDHARQIRDHVAKLAAKGYWEQFSRAPDFVFLFIPGESFLSSALEYDPGLLEEGYRRGVHLVTPTSLISNLRAVAQGWRDEAMAEHARTVSGLGKELYDRLRSLADHFAKLGRSLESAVGHYNGAVGSLESRVLVSARRFSDLGIPAGEEIPALEPIDRAPRALQASELVSEVVQVPRPERALPEGARDDGDGVADAA